MKSICIVHFHEVRNSMLRFVCIVFLLLSGFANAQAKHAPAPKVAAETTPAPAADLPVTNLVLAPGKPVAGVDSSFAVMQPVLCTAEGQILMEIPIPPTYMSYRVDALSPKEGHQFDFQAIPDHYDAQLMSFSPAGSDIVFLFIDAEENKVSDYRVETSTGQIATGKVNRSAHHFYIVRYSLDGKYQSKTQLPDGPNYLKIAALGQNQFVLLFYDWANRAPVLKIFDADGRPGRSIILPGEMADDAVVQQGETGDDQNASKAITAVAGWQFIPARGKVLLYHPHTTEPAVEIGAGGFRREVPLSAPAGYLLDAFIPSEKHWYARFRRATVDDHHEVDATVASKNYLLAELNPSDGSLVRLFSMESGSFFNLACEADGAFIGYSNSQDGKFLLSSTEIPR